MQTRFGERTGIALSVVLVVLTSFQSHGATPASDFNAAKQSFSFAMKNPNVKVRVAAVATLSEFAQVGAADLLLKKGVTDGDEKVRLAARGGLKKLASDVAIADFLMEEFKKASHRQVTSPAAVEVIRALVSVDDEDRRARLLNVLDEVFANPKNNLLLSMTFIDELGEQGDADSVRVVEFFSKAKIFKDHFGYRRCCIQAMINIRQPEAVDFLIEFLPKADGIIQYDVVTYLTRLTKQLFRTDVNGWRTWWEKNRNEFEFPEQGKDLEEIDDDYEGLSYYRIPVCAKRIVFVLDTSGSMQGVPIELAKEALANVILALPEETQFNFMTFSGSVDMWQKRMLPATPKNKRMAVSAVMSRVVGGVTASSAALNAAFHQQPEAIYFVSDGMPTDGVPAQIVEHFTRINKLYRVSIHTVGVVTSAASGFGLPLFMEPLANRNYGKSRLIE